ncbi:hypothetical protein DL237_20105 [Pseudooceanicola sediminis]|uniref:Uncharacterized protein n=1 Tax=Pseudooceanicola sediminis TaxID=2211117 RepID=A0A399IZ59_9RHOB|nr:hypothetical protein DL237_20105 [Pseudooceanicola sediminis]
MSDKGRALPGGEGALPPSLARPPRGIFGQMTGRMRGRMRGGIRGRLNGRLTGRMRGRMRGQLNGQMKGQRRRMRASVSFAACRGPVSVSRAGMD